MQQPHPPRRLPLLLLSAWIASAPVASLAAGAPASAEIEPEAAAAAQKKKKKKKGEGKEPAAEAKKKSSDPDAPGDEGGGARGFRFVLKQYPSFRFGKFARVDFRSKVQADFRGFEPEHKTKEGFWDLHRARVAIEGNVLKIVEFQVEREIRDVFRELFVDLDEGNETTNPWRDVFVNVRYFRRAQVQVGKFKIPFGREQLTGSSKLDFIFRSRVSDALTPARDKGIMVHGRLFERALGYEAGYFREDGENARTLDNQGSGRNAVALRLTGTPLRPLPVPGLFKETELGIAFVRSRLPEGLNGLHARMFDKNHIFPRMFVQGTRLRIGSELAWMPGPFSVKGEFIHVRDERLEQSLRDEDLPDLIGRGWYLTGTWALTGEKKAGGIEPKHEFLRGWGFGAVEIAARCEQLRFGSSEHPGTPSRSTRGANIRPQSDRAWTFGVNWYLNRWVKVQGNFLRERIEDSVRRPISGVETYWTRVLRLQFEL